MKRSEGSSGSDPAGPCETGEKTLAIDNLHPTERVTRRKSAARIHELMGEHRRRVLDHRDPPFRDVAVASSH
jgi:hypothetical protein